MLVTEAQNCTYEVYIYYVCTFSKYRCDRKYQHSRACYSMNFLVSELLVESISSGLTLNSLFSFSLKFDF